MVTSDKQVIPAVATHPGSVLKKELKARGIKQKDFAKVINMPAPNLSELIKGKRNITEAIAFKLEEALGIPFQNWINLQTRYYYVKKLREEVEWLEQPALAEENRNADQSANDNLITPMKWHQIMMSKPNDLSPDSIMHAIVSGAESMGVKPSIVIARYLKVLRYYSAELITRR